MKKRINDIIVDAIDIACYGLMIAFAIFTAILALCAFVMTFVEGDAFYLVGTAAGALLTWFIWSVGVESAKGKRHELR